jgi:hypothetical protein
LLCVLRAGKKCDVDIFEYFFPLGKRTHATHAKRVAEKEAR